MADRIDNLELRLSRVEEKVDTLATSIEAGFHGVDIAIDEQRKYTESAFSRLESKVDAGFAQVDVRFARIERKLDQFIDVQIESNQLVERRLRALES